MTPTDAEAILKSYPEFDWVTKSTQPWWTVGEVADNIAVSDFVIRQRCNSGAIPGAIFLSNQTGWRIPRTGLLVFLASLPRGGQS